MTDIKLIFSAMVFLGISTLLLGQAAYADASLVGGGQSQITSDACLQENNTAANIECTVNQASQISGLVNSSSDLQAISLIILIPLSGAIAYIVISKILIPLAEALIPG